MTKNKPTIIRSAKAGFTATGQPLRVLVAFFMKEIWKPIPGFEGTHEASDLGRIKSLSRLVPFGHGFYRLKNEKILSGTITNGYIQVTIKIKNSQFKTHRLVALTFIPNPENKPQINHKDGNKLNNRADNLEWCTAGENTRHAWSNGLCRRRTGDQHWSSRLTEIDVDEIRSKYKPHKYTSKMLASEYGVSRGHISNIVHKFRRPL